MTTKDKIAAYHAAIDYIANRQVIVSVAQIGRSWRITIDGNRLGDARGQPTKEAAIKYAREITRNWKHVDYRF